MSLLLAATREAGLILCLTARVADPCAVSPIVVEGEVVPTTAVERGRFTWRVDGKEVYAGVITFEGGQPQKVAMVLEPRKPHHVVTLEVNAGKARGKGEVHTPSVICPFVVELEDFAVSSRGVELVLANRGPYPSGPGVLEWRLNGRRLGRTRLDSMPPGGQALVVLPAQASSALQKALSRHPQRASTRNLVPVVVSAHLELAPSPLSSAAERLDLVVGYVEQGLYPDWHTNWWYDLDSRPVQRFPELPPHTHVPPPPRR